MKLIVVEKNNKIRLNKITEFLLYLISYTISFIIVSSMFDTFVLSKEHWFIYSIISVLLILILNKTVKPILLVLTIPITGLTLGAFYFVVNMIILKLVDFIMGSKLDFTNIWMLFFISIMISLINLIIELLIVKPIIRRVKSNA